MDAVETDIVIAGGGPAGATCAALLARQGRRVIVLEEKRFPREKVCGECLSSAALGALDALGLRESLERESVAIQSLRVSAQRAVWETDLQSSAEAPRAITRATLDDLLRQVAVQAGAEFRTGWRVRRAVLERHVVRGVQATPVNETRPIWFRAPLTIAADGRHSTLARQVGQLIESRRAPLLGFKRHVADAAVDDVPTLDMYSAPGGYVGVCPLRGGGLNVCGVAPYDVAQSDAHSLAQRVVHWCRSQSRLRTLLQGDESAVWLTMPGIRRQRRLELFPGVVFLGDAQQTVAPVAGQGMTIAAVSAVGLAAMIDRKDTIEVQDLARRWQAWSAARFGAFCRRAERFDWLLRHPKLLAALGPCSRLAPASAKSLVHRIYLSTLFS